MRWSRVLLVLALLSLAAADYVLVSIPLLLTHKGQRMTEQVTQSTCPGELIPTQDIWEAEKYMTVVFCIVGDPQNPEGGTLVVSRITYFGDVQTEVLSTKNARDWPKIQLWFGRILELYGVAPSEPLYPRASEREL